MSVTYNLVEKARPLPLDNDRGLVDGFCRQNKTKRMCRTVSFFFLVFFSSQSSTSVIISGDKDRAIISHRPRLLYTRSVLQNLRGQEI